MRELVKRILETPFFRNIFKLSMSSLVVMGLSILCMPILSRIFTPEAYGEWGVFSSTSLILGSIIFLSYENAIVKASDSKELPSVFWLCILSSLVIIFITIVVFLVGEALMIEFFVSFPSLLWLVAFLIVTSLDVLFTSIANRYAKYNTMTVAGIVIGVIQPISRILFGLIPLAKGLIYGNILGLISKNSYFFSHIKDILRNDFLIKTTIHEIKQTAIKYSKFPLFDAPAKLLEFFIGNIVIIVLSIYFNLEEIGCFSMVAQLVQIPINLVGTSMSTVYFKDMAEVVVTGDRAQLALITRRTIKVCFLMAFVFSLFFIFGGDRLLVMFLGHKWVLSGDMSLCLLIFTIPLILSEPLMPIFKVLEKQNLRFWLNIVNLVLSISVLIIGAYLVSNILVVLILYSLCYALIRFIMFRYQVRLANVIIGTFKKELLALVVVYIFLAVRLYFAI